MPSIYELRKQAADKLGFTGDMQLSSYARSLIDAEVDKLQAPTVPTPNSDEGGGVADWLLEASKGFQMAAKLGPDLVSFAGNLAMDDFNQTGLGEAAQSASGFFDRGVQAATDLQSQGFRDRSSAPIYDEATGEWHAPNSTQVLSTVLTALPQIPAYALGGGAATGAMNAARLAPRAYKMAKLAGLGSGASLKLARALPGMAGYGVAGGALGSADTYSEAYGSVMEKLEEYDIPDGQKDRVASKLATEAGLRQMPVAALMNAVGLGTAANTAGALWKRIAVGAVSEIPAEVIEEAGQGLNVNRSIQKLDPSYDIWAGVRTRAALGAIAGGVMGGGVAALEGNPARQRALAELQADINASPDDILSGKHAVTLPESPIPEEKPVEATPRFLMPPKPDRSEVADQAWKHAEVAVALAADSTEALEKAIPGWGQMSNKKKAEIIDAVIDADGQGHTEKGAAVQKWAENQAAAVAALQNAHALDNSDGKPGDVSNDIVGSAEASAPVAADQSLGGPADALASPAGGEDTAAALPLVREDVPGVSESLVAQPALKSQKKNPRAVNAERDDLLAAVAKLGGISQAEARAQGFDPADFKRTPAFGQKLFRKNGGDTLDGLAERLHELGYPVADARGSYSGNVLLDRLRDALGGKKVRTPMGDTWAMQLEEQRRDLQRGKTGSLPEPEAGPEFTPAQSAVGALYADAIQAGYTFQQLDALITDQDSLAEIHRKLSALLTGESDVQPEGHGNSRRQDNSEEADQEEVPGFDQPGDDLSDFSDEEVDRLFKGEKAADIRASRTDSPDNFSLTTQTEDDIRAKEAREQDAKAAEEAERKRQVDATSDTFTLSTGTGTAGAQGKPAVAGGQTGLSFREERQQALAERAERDNSAGRRDNYHDEPTDAQKEAGNYKKEKVKWHGLDISIENQAGTMRRGTDPNGKKWEVQLQFDYGYVRGTKGADGDHVDVYLGPNMTGEKVFIVNQTHANGKFDEHKVMLGFESEKAATDAYLSNYEKGWDRYKDVVEMSVDQFKAWLDSGATGKPALTPEPVVEEQAEPAARGDRIEDFGEKIGGARKDVWGGFKSSLEEELPADLKAITLSKYFPEPDYAKLIEAGVQVETLAAIKAMRDQMPAKPRQSWKLRAWVENLSVLRDLSARMLDGRISFEDMRSKMLGQSLALARFVDKIDIYAGVGYPAFLKAEGASLSWGTHFTYEGNNRTDHPNTYSVSYNSRHFTDQLFTSKAGAIAALRDYITKLGEAEKKPRETKLDLYRVTATGKVMIGKKIGTNRYIDLKEFDSVKEARAYLAEHEDELLAQLEKFREQQNNVPTRRSTNDPRVGEDYRQGEDISTEAFGKAFGFRGVEFGNWVEQGRRQHDLNNAYDALMDLAKITGIPPKAVSLNGSLGLAFGARGRAGAAAHYEPDKVVINLTKKEGAGALGHEWWHAMDNYFSRMRGLPGELLTARPHELKQTGVRPEVISAFGNLMKAIKASPMAKRSAALDKHRPKDYWSTPEELSARAFEAYVIAKTKEKGEANDYLANLIDPATAQVVFEGGTTEWPYPFDNEMTPIVAAFDELFRTIKTKETDKGVAMYRRGEASWYYSPLQRAVDGIKQETAPAAQWVATIAKMPGVKPEEIEWTGLNEWLELQQGKVTKQQILEYLDANGVQVTETMRGDGANLDQLRTDLDATADKYGLRIEEEGFGDERQVYFLDMSEYYVEWDLLPDELQDAANAYAGAANGTGDNTKYSKYTLPGGENYRELLLTLPSSGGNFPAFEEWMQQKYGESVQGSRRQAAMNEYQKAMSAQESTTKAYRSSHWQEPNIVAHIRFNERTDAEGKRVLFVEEIQSDWAQEGKKKGFAKSSDKFTAVNGYGGWTVRNGDRLLGIFPADSAEAAIRKAKDFYGESSSNIPSAPFVGKTDAWVSLAIKRMIRYAAENGFERVAFVNGEQSAERYDLSKQISRIKSSKYANGDYRIAAFGQGDRNNVLVVNDSYTAEQLPDVVGKEIADKIVQGATNVGEEFVIEGLDLKVGGEGMKAFYDRIVPTVAKDVLKKLGGGKLQPVSINIHGGTQYQVQQDSQGKWVAYNPADQWDFVEFDSEQKARDYANRVKLSEQNGFDITPEMREKAMAGMPLFKREQAAQVGVSKADAEAALRQDKFIARLIDAGRIVIHESGSSLPGEGADKDGILGVATPDGVIHLNAGAHDSVAGLKPTAYHEAFHARLKPLIGDKSWGKLMQQLNAIYEQGLKGDAKVDAFFRKALEQVESDAVGQDNLTRAQKVEELGAYAIDSYDTAPKSLRMWVDMLLAKVKAWALNYFGVQMGKVSPAQLRELAKMAIRDTHYDAYRASLKPAHSRAVDNPAGDVTVGWKMLATDADLFKLPKSEAKALPDIFAEIDPGIRVSEDAQEAKRVRQETGKPVSRAFVLEMPRQANGRTVYDKAHVYEAGRELWLNIATGKEGVSGGFRVYAGIGNYAFNTGKVFIGDPMGLSDAALLRRTEHMLSLALKFGTTSFMLPHQKQVAPASDSMSKLKGKVRPLDWRVGDDEHNLVELVKGAYTNILPFAPEVRNVDFDPVSGRFIHAESRKPVTDAEWGQLQLEYERRLESLGVTAPVGGGQGGARPAGSSLPRGSATLKRAAFAHSLLRRTSRQDRRNLLAFLGGKLQGGIEGELPGVAGTDLSGVFYRRKSQLPAGPLPGGTFNAAQDYADSLVDNLVYNYQDRFIDLRRLQGKIGKVPENQDASLAETRYSGAVMAKTQEFQRGERDELLKAIHSSKLTFEEVETYLNAKDAPYRNAAMKEINPTQAELDAKRATLEAETNRLFALPTVKDYLRVRRELRRFEEEVDEGLADASALFKPKREIATLKKDPDVDAYIRSTGELSTLRDVKAYKGDNTALSGMSDKEAADIVAKAKVDGKFAALEKVSGMVDAITTKTRQEMVDAGLITQAEVDAWAKKYPHYIPRHREEVGGDTPVVGTGRGFNIRGKESKRATGSERKVVDILAHIMAQRETAIIRAEKVKVDRALYELLQANPNPDVAVLDTIPKVKMVDATTGTVVERIDPLYKNRPNVLTFKMNGEEHTIEFNDESPEMLRLAVSLKNMDSQQLGDITKMVGRFTRFLATMNTTANPVFVARNFLRDLQTAFVNLTDTELADMKKDVFRDIPKAIRGFWAMNKGDMSSEFAKHAKEFRDAGGQTGWMEHTAVIGDRAKEMKAQLERMEPGKWNVTRQQASKLWELVEDSNNAVENGIRLSAFVNARRAGLTAGKAAELAKNLTVNFNRRGAKSVELNMWYMFMNASIQGTARLAKAAGNKEVQKILGYIIASGFLMDLMARALADDEDEDGENDYDQLPEYVKASNWVFWVGGQPITVPQPYGYNFFSSVGRKMSETLFRKDYSPLQGASELASAFVGAFSPIGQTGSLLQAVAPTVADPFVQYAENKNFAGNPLYKEQLPFGVPKPDYQMAFKSTSESSKWLAEVLNFATGGNAVRPGAIDINPASIDFAISSLVGGAGRSYLQAFNLPIKALSGEDIEAREVPFLNIFGSAQPENQLEGKFFERLRSVELAVKEAKEYAGTPEAAAIRRDRADELSLAARAKMVSASLRILREKEKAVGLTREQRKAIEDRKKVLMAGFVKSYTERVAQ